MSKIEMTTSGGTARALARELIDDYCSITAVRDFLDEELRLCSALIGDTQPEKYGNYEQGLQQRIDKCIEGLHKINNINYYTFN